MNGIAQERGFGILIVVIIMAFMMTLGIAMMTITGTGSKVAGNIRNQEKAFNAAEAGFNYAWISVEEMFLAEVWDSFSGHYLTEPSGIDLPSSTYYFRRLTDQEIFALIDTNGDGTPDVNNVLFFQQAFIPVSGGGLDTNITYTIFLIDDEAGGSTPDPLDTLMVCIGAVGTGPGMTTARIEIELAKNPEEEG